ncbi:sterol desaturase family protein [Leucothrix arctica]|uniref:Fatty acid hydroxylase domain-containing protein n=1 Tax=Leucothrix arctica TaxID=1481894 RepID=A0A317C5B8_9GAMM|nr:sterol desaturase family protein [Leucothrix arctica]PWQ93814.1 hypothetical protein DKT75_19620 [Leucothrix arctica]
MKLFTMEHSKIAYRADFALYGIAVMVLAAFIIIAEPHGQWLESLVLLGIGLVSWTLLEYVLHRFVMHGLQPFSRWHAEHHQRPRALISTPTVLSMMLITTLIFLPAFMLSDNLWSACALTLGIVIGYLSFAIVHHATHHWSTNSAWLKRRKHWHSLHHRSNKQPSCFGVTSTFWDYVFGSTRKQRK